MEEVEEEEEEEEEEEGPPHSPKEDARGGKGATSHRALKLLHFWV